MPLGYDIYPDIGLLFMRCQGKVPQSERMDAILASFRDPQYGCCSDALIDIADVTSTPRVSELRELIAMLGQQMPADGPRRLANEPSDTMVVPGDFSTATRYQG